MITSLFAQVCPSGGCPLPCPCGCAGACVPLLWAVVAVIVAAVVGWYVRGVKAPTLPRFSMTGFLARVYAAVKAEAAKLEKGMAAPESTTGTENGQKPTPAEQKPQ